MLAIVSRYNNQYFGTKNLKTNKKEVFMDTTIAKQYNISKNYLRQKKSTQNEYNFMPELSLPSTQKSVRWDYVCVRFGGDDQSAQALKNINSRLAAIEGYLRSTDERLERNERTLGAVVEERNDEAQKIGAAVQKLHEGITRLEKLGVKPQQEPIVDPYITIGQKTLLLDSRIRLNDETLTKIQRTIVDCWKRKEQPLNLIDPDKARVFSISYEGSGFAAGGQSDVATEVPIALTEQGIKTWSISPAFSYRKDGKAFGLTERDGKFFYDTAKDIAGHKKPEGGYELQLIHEFDIHEGTPSKKLQVFYNNDLKTFFLRDYDEKGSTFDLGEIGSKGNIYNNSDRNPEKPRMAQFNNLTFEFLSNCMESKVNIDVDGKKEAIKPTSMISHEAWQSGGLLMKLNLLTHAREASNGDDKLSTETANALRELADKTLVPIHNCGDGYQGKIWNEGEIAQYIHNIFGPYSHDMVNRAFNIRESAGTKGGWYNLIHSDFKKFGFIVDPFNPQNDTRFNPALTALTLGRCGTVSDGYLYEILPKKTFSNGGDLSGDLGDIITIKKDSGGLFALPNGVDKDTYIPKISKVANFRNKAQNQGVTDESALELWSQIKPYFNDNGELLSSDEIRDAKRTNQRIMIQLLKKQFPTVTENGLYDFELPNIGIYPGDVSRRKNILLGRVNIEKAADDTPIFSSVARLDDQKGPEVMIQGYRKLMDKWTEKVASLRNSNRNEEADRMEARRPIFICNLSGCNDEIKDAIMQIKRDMWISGDRLIVTNSFIGDQGLDFINMASTGVYTSDFEPYGIAELKALYGGNHIIHTNVGGMKNVDSVSRKEYSVTPEELSQMIENNNYENLPKNTNAIMLSEEYKPLCSLDNTSRYNNPQRDHLIHKYGEQLANAMMCSALLPEDVRLKLDMNAARTDVSWDKGAIQNYIDRMGIQRQQNV